MNTHVSLTAAEYTRGTLLQTMELKCANFNSHNNLINRYEKGLREHEKRQDDEVPFSTYDTWLVERIGLCNTLYEIAKKLRETGPLTGLTDLQRRQLDWIEQEVPLLVQRQAVQSLQIVFLRDRQRLAYATLSEEEAATRADEIRINEMLLGSNVMTLLSSPLIELVDELQEKVTAIQQQLYQEAAVLLQRNGTAH